MTVKYRLLTLLAVLALAVLALGAAPVQAEGEGDGPDVAPIFVPGNPSCTDLGYAYGFKPQPEPPPSGTYTFPDGINTVTIDSNGTYFSWSSTLGIDAVIVKGGPNANAYVYEPPAESYGDDGLSSPINSNTGQPFGISHIEFCYDYEVVVSKTAVTTFTRTFEWTIDKSVVPEKLDMFTGDSGTVEYTVAVEKTGYTDSDWAVSGEISIHNPAPAPATITGVSDTISPDIAAAVDCGVGFPYALASGGTLTCSYASDLPDGTNRVNTATVTTSGAVGGGDTTADVIFGDPTTKVNDTVNVADTNGGAWPFSDSGAVTYERTFTCDTDEGQHDNTATIDETGQNDSASVVVNCYALQVTKDADTSFTRTWDWTIAKTGDQSEMTLSLGQQFLVNYDVTVDATSTDSAWAVTGNIAVYNPAPIAATLNGVADVVSPGIQATVDCGVTFPYVLAAGGTLPCSYNADLPDATSRTNTATATLQNTPSGTTDFTGSADVTFGATPSTEIDECVQVTDDPYGVLGEVCADDDAKTFTFEYSLRVGPYDVCGLYEFVNIAEFVTNDTGTTGSDDWTVDVNVPCQGCTLTQGYWKTHSEFGPAPYDDTWAQLSNGASTPFFLSGKSWYDVFWTAPAGNAYYNLAHQYMAAKLNLLNGAASTPEVDAAITWAENFFNTYTPDSTLSRILRNQVMQAASTLDKYNNGLIGPGHCSDDARISSVAVAGAVSDIFLPAVINQD